MSFALQLARQPSVLLRVSEMEKAKEECAEWIPWRMAKLRADRRHVFAESFRIVIEEHGVVIVFQSTPAFAFAEWREQVHAHYAVADVWAMANAFAVTRPVAERAPSTSSTGKWQTALGRTQARGLGLLAVMRNERLLAAPA